MAKGISAVIATIMLLMITVALIGVFYVFSSELMTGGINSAGGAAAATVDRMLKTIALSAATCTNTSTPTVASSTVNFTVQNVGTKDLLANELTVYVDDSVYTPQAGALVSGLAANARARAGVQLTTSNKTRTLKVQGPSNVPISYLTC